MRDQGAPRRADADHRDPGVSYPEGTGLTRALRLLYPIAVEPQSRVVVGGKVCVWEMLVPGPIL